MGFNVFSLISEKYYLENFHSDILFSILNPDGLHKEGYIFLESFIKYLSGIKDQKQLNYFDYSNSIVQKEVGKIDIAIKDPVSKKAIIIENKINNALDQPRQIPRYHSLLITEGYEVEAIVYLTLNSCKNPNTLDWTVAERETILPKLISICAFNETKNDLLNGWLYQCDKLAKNVDVLFTLRQYNHLISYLGQLSMNKPLMEDFLQMMLQGENFKTATTVNSMLSDLVTYRRDKLLEFCQQNSHPFTKIHGWSYNYTVLNDFFIDDYHFAIDLIVEPGFYRFQFIERKYLSSQNKLELKDPIESFLESAGYLKDFFKNGERREKIFQFPSQENELYEFIPEFLKSLRAYYKK